MIKLNLELDANNWRHMKAAAMFFGQLVKQDEAAPYVVGEAPEEYVERTDAEQAEQAEQAIEAMQEAQKAKAQKAEAEALEAEKKAVKAARDKARREKIKAEKEVRNGGTEESEESEESEKSEESEESEEADTEEGTDEDETKLTLNDVRSIVSEKAKLAGAREKIVAELKGFGVENTTKLDAKHYSAFVNFLKTLS